MIEPRLPVLRRRTGHEADPLDSRQALQAQTHERLPVAVPVCGRSPLPPPSPWPGRARPARDSSGPGRSTPEARSRAARPLLTGVASAPSGRHVASTHRQSRPRSASSSCNTSFTGPVTLSSPIRTSTLTRSFPATRPLIGSIWCRFHAPRAANIGVAVTANSIGIGDMVRPAGRIPGYSACRECRQTAAKAPNPCRRRLGGRHSADVSVIPVKFLREPCRPLHAASCVSWAFWTESTWPGSCSPGDPEIHTFAIRGGHMLRSAVIGTLVACLIGFAVLDAQMGENRSSEASVTGESSGTGTDAPTLPAEPADAAPSTEATASEPQEPSASQEYWAESRPPAGTPRSLPKQLFPADNWWNLNISAVPVDPKSATYIAALAPVRLTYDWGNNYGIPYITVSGDYPSPVPRRLLLETK